MEGYREGVGGLARPPRARAEAVAITFREWVAISYYSRQTHKHRKEMRLHWLVHLKTEDPR